MNPVFPNGWLAFELSVLRRLKFSSIAMPFTGEPDLAVKLKRWNVRVAANDLTLWAHTKAIALVENYSERLSPEEIEMVVGDAYVPGVDMDNPALLKWFNETDAWWLTNVRANAEQLETSYKQAIALTIGMMVGDYVLSFDEQTRHLRQPLSLSNVFTRICEALPQPFDNSLESKAFHQETRAFLAERQHTSLLFLRLPPPVFELDPTPHPLSSWREEWLRGNDEFWPEMARNQAGRLGSRVQSKQQYLGFVEDLLRTAAHIPNWAIAHIENGFISSEELVDAVQEIRDVDAVYSKDFSDLLGVRASIVTVLS
ncbi:MAG TPA: hypothetical protein VJ023_18645 [Pyrinomonadaceae bacterium]|nr:hypothetical protein [Pyrinomonadaceae bacterium]